MKSLVFPGARSGFLTAVEISGRREGHTLWKCICDCGVERVVSAGNFLHAAKAKSCACSRAANGESLKWLLAHVNHVGDECLIWPFSTSGGYAQINGVGSSKKACRIMCEAAHGPAPAGLNTSLHSCGNGHSGCINPNHLAWGTQHQNILDRARDGTDNKGSRNGQSRLSEDIVRQIRAMASTTTLFHREIADQFGVRRQTIDDIISGRRWGWLS